MKQLIKILLVDDQGLFREGVRTLCSVMDEFEVVGEAGNGEEALRLAALTKPDVILMDLRMPIMDGVTATRRLREILPNCKVIVLTTFDDDEFVFEGLRAGAVGYLLKDVSPDDLVEAIRAVHHGEARLHPDIARKLMQQVSQMHNITHGSSIDELTGREQEVLRLVARGRSNREIAEDLFISEKTVKTHVSNILGKLHLEQRTQLVVYAIKNKLVEAQ